MFDVVLEWGAAPWVYGVQPLLSFLGSYWHTLETAVILSSLYWVRRRNWVERRRLKETVDRMIERVERLDQIARAARDTAEGPASTLALAAAAQRSDGLALYDDVRAEWGEMRDRLELAIERIPYPQLRAKYGRMGRRSYREVIQMLAADGQIPRPAEEALLDMNQRFAALALRPGATSESDVAAFRSLGRSVHGALPRLGSSRASEPRPQPQPISEAAE